MEMKSARRNGHLARGKSIGSSSRRTKKKMSLNKYYSSFSASLPLLSLCPFDYSPPSIAMECDFNKLIFEILELILSVLIFPPSLVFALCSTYLQEIGNSSRSNGVKVFHIFLLIFFLIKMKNLLIFLSIKAKILESDYLSKAIYYFFSFFYNLAPLFFQETFFQFYPFFFALITFLIPFNLWYWIFRMEREGNSRILYFILIYEYSRNYVRGKHETEYKRNTKFLHATLTLPDRESRKL